MTDKEKLLSNIWKHKISAAQIYFEKWERKFKCKTLEKYMEGFQWTDADETYEPYVLNLFFATFATKRPSLLFTQPIYYIEPMPVSYDSMPEEAYNWAQNASDVLNTFVTSDKLNYGEELELAIVDALPYFGIVEVGYSANWTINPNANKPIDPLDPLKQEKSDEPEEIPEQEHIFVKRIPAHRFRVGGNDCSDLRRADWCGYYEFYRTQDLQQKKLGFKNVKELEYAGTHTDEFKTEYNDEENQLETSGDLVKVWKIWDNRKKQFYIITNDTSVILYERPFDRLPLFDIRFFKRRKGWYPIPLSYNWKSPQDEINETREQVRAARRRAKRAYQIKTGNVDNDEVDKLMNGRDGITIWTNQDNAIGVVPNPPLDATLGIVLQTSKDDFNVSAGTTAEQRGEADRVTATQTNVSNQRATIRENEERKIVAKWICRIGLEILYQVIERTTLPIWTKITSDLGGFFKDVPELEYQWKMLQKEDLGYIDYKVNVTVESLSPIANDIEKKKFLEFLAIMNQYPQLATNPDLIREAAFRLDYKNNKVIKAFQQAALLQMVGQVAQGQENLGQPPQPNNMAQMTAEQMMPPDQAQIENQMNTMGVPQ